MDVVNFALTIPEVIKNILLFVPVSSLCKMGCVSNSWRDSVNKVWQYIGLENLVINLEKRYDTAGSDPIQTAALAYIGEVLRGLLQQRDANSANHEISMAIESLRVNKQGSIIWLPVESWGSNPASTQLRMSQFVWLLYKIIDLWQNKNTLRIFVSEMLNFFNILDHAITKISTIEKDDKICVDKLTFLLTIVPKNEVCALLTRIPLRQLKKYQVSNGVTNTYVKYTLRAQIMLNLKDYMKSEHLSAITSVLYSDSHLVQTKYFQDFVHLLEALILICKWNIEQISVYVSETLNTWRLKNDARLEFLKAFVEMHYHDTMPTNRMQNLLEIGSLGNSVFQYSNMDVVLKLKLFMDWLTKQYTLADPESKALMRMLSQPIKSVAEKGPTVSPTRRSLRSRQLDDEDAI